MDLTTYLQAGYAALFVETMEIKRTLRDVKVAESFARIIWNMDQGLVNNSKEGVELAAADAILDQAKGMKKTCLLLENFDWFFSNPMIIQKFLNNYTPCKINQTCMVIVGTDATRIPLPLRELIPVVEFNLPDREKIKKITAAMQANVQETLVNTKDKGKGVASGYDITVTDDLIESCLGLTMEEIENVLALSIIETKRFDIETIRKRKRQAIKQTGFMDFFQAEPIANLGGLTLLKDYMLKRLTAFEPGSIKPKFQSVLFVGFPGTGKTLAAKVLINLLNWPGILLDVGSLKGGIVGDTEKNTRLATKTIDAFGKCVVVIDEIEKAFAGSTGRSLDGGASAGILGHFLTWMQERTSSGILIATSNDLSALPPEFLRAGRWDAIFFVDLPGPEDIKQIIEIMNRKWQAQLPLDETFIERLATEGWTGAEIEQLAKDSHFDPVDDAMADIPILARTKKPEMDKIREQAHSFRSANRAPVSLVPTDKPVRRKLQIGGNPSSGTMN